MEAWAADRNYMAQSLDIATRTGMRSVVSRQYVEDVIQ